MTKAEAISLGIRAMVLAPVVEVHDDSQRKWKFIGLWSESRPEWWLVQVAGMFQSVTSVACWQ